MITTRNNTEDTNNAWVVYPIRFTPLRSRGGFSLTATCSFQTLTVAVR
jgi:hypothetical protein